jgi:hypothetical protein
LLGLFWDQQMPVMGSAHWPPGHGLASAGDAVIIGVAIIPAPRTAAARRREAVDRIFMNFLRAFRLSG